MIVYMYFKFHSLRMHDSFFRLESLRFHGRALRNGNRLRAVAGQVQHVDLRRPGHPGNGKGQPERQS